MATTKKPSTTAKTSTAKTSTAKTNTAKTSAASAKASSAAKTDKSSTTVGRQELSRRIAQQAKISQKQASEVLEATLTSIREALEKGDEVRLVGFGSFKVRTSAARKGVNPRDRQPIEVPAKERVRFSPGKELSDAVVKK